ncbi:hypothetical protein F2P81_021547 [Scophthalmus maximus]|uniref:Phospholipase A1 member A n=1 Tax=Scophthalmus maximus TaxID=52904 RepID=A0A6A4S5K0_SCOMX|nr:hypothetical protein F2P81_021547 [Scophthalmus maximus]
MFATVLTRFCESASDFGISIPVGHVDFYLNGGKDQAGCARSRFPSILIYFPVYGYVICDHMRALHVYLSALNGSCPLRGVPCPNYEDFLTGQCVDCDVFKGTCPTIGDNTPRREILQCVFFKTSCCSSRSARHILLELEVSPLDKSAEVEVTLRTENLGTEQRLRLWVPTSHTAYHSVTIQPRLHIYNAINTSPLKQFSSIRLTEN